MKGKLWNVNQKLDGGGELNKTKCLKTVVIGASADSVYAIKVARKRGIFVYAIDGNPEAEGLKEADKGIVCDIADVNKTEEIIREINPNFILTVPVGRYLYTTACVNEDFNFKGIKKKFTEISVDKFKFHEFLNKNGLRNIKLYLLKPYAETIKKIYDIKFPAIIKPRFGSGSRDMFYIETQKELDKVLDKLKNSKEDFIFEEFVEGVEYCVDAAKIHGKLRIILVRKRMLTDLPQRQAVANISLGESEKEKIIKERIKDKIKKVCDAMGYDDCLIQSDIIVNDNNVFVIEISPRPSGHYIYDKFVPFVTGVDMTKEYINYMALGEEYCSFTPVYTKKAIIKYFDFENKKISYIPNKEEVENNIECGLIDWKCNIKENDYMNKVTNGHSIMGRGYFILEGEDDEKLINDSNRVLNLFY